MLNMRIPHSHEMSSKISFYSKRWDFIQLDKRVQYSGAKIFHAKIFKVYDYLNHMLVTSYEGELKFY